MINNMEKVKNNGLINLLMLEHIIKGRRMEKDISLGLINQNMKANFKKTISKDGVFMLGPMEEYTKENGKITKWRAKENSPGLIIEIMRVSIKMIKNTVMVYFVGPMAENIREDGRMENSMVAAPTYPPTIKLVKENGMKEKD